jgi:hypothetical protein
MSTRWKAIIGSRNIKIEVGNAQINFYSNFSYNIVNNLTIYVY